MPLLYPEDAVGDGLPTWTSPRRWGGIELLKYDMLFMPASSAPGDMEIGRWPGEGVVVKGDSWFDACSLPERDLLLAAAAAAALAP